MEKKQSIWTKPIPAKVVVWFNIIVWGILLIPTGAWEPVLALLLFEFWPFTLTAFLWWWVSLGMSKPTP